MTTKEDLIFKDGFFKVVDGESPAAGNAVKLSSGELVLTSSEDDPLCIGIVQESFIQTDASMQTSVKDCLGNTYNHSVVKKVQKVKSSGISAAFLDDGGGAISAGDLLTTCTKSGFLQKQAASGVQAYTVAQAVVDAVFDGNGEQLDAVVLLRG